MKRFLAIFSDSAKRINESKVHCHDGNVDSSTCTAKYICHDSYRGEYKNIFLAFWHWHL